MSDITRQIVTRGLGHQCWVEKRIHTGSMASRYAGCYARCEKDRRRDHLTCWWHRKFEDEAQALKASNQDKTSNRANLEREIRAGLRSPHDLKTQ